ncbi:MAG: di-trans,poly-cis-decaprenylcistransferase [Bacilli bacterium]|nr:di-trans,poly-cis-decaprenylcistransferase [Bacilli bacterium]
MKVPNHLAFIVDGNGRWAKMRGKNRSEGHLAGFINLKKIIKYTYSKKVKYLSAYLFSTENFKRSEQEVSFIMGLLTSKLKEILDLCHEEKIKVVFSGRKTKLSKKVLGVIEKIEKETSIYNDRIFNICFNYGGRAEIIDACIKIAKDYSNGNIKLECLDEDMFNSYLYHDLPPVDLMIRTSGEERISNFMLWQCSYAEFYFTSVLFPDFNEEEFDKAMVDYTNRDRRFGGIDYEKKDN